MPGQFCVIQDRISALRSLDGSLEASLNRHDSLTRSRKCQSRSRDGQDTIGRQTGSHMTDIVPFGQYIAAHELARDVAVSVLPIVVFTLDGDASVIGAYGDLLRRELLHVHDHLVLVLVALDRRRATHLTVQILKHVTPRPECVLERRKRRRPKIIVLQAQLPKMILYVAMPAIHIAPPVTEYISRYQSHDFLKLD